MKKILLVIVGLICFQFASWGQACIGSQTLTATPLPSGNGTYFSGTTVTFCYTAVNYAQNTADWICGVVPTFGPGWDLTTLTPVSAAASCDGQGNWAWYTNCTGTASGQSFGPGFYYDSPAGSVSGTLDGIPGNNFGDNCQTNTWTFCFSIQVLPCTSAPNGTDLTVDVNSYSDYVVGSWGNDGCVDPPATQEAAVFCNCTLIVPTVVVTDATCNSANDGSITVTASGVPPYTYLWNTGATTPTLSNIPAGIYTITVTDSTLCDKVITIPVGGDPAILLNPLVINNGCNTSGGSIDLTPAGGSGTGYTYLWSDGSTGSSLGNLVAGTYSVTVTDSHGCTETDTYTIVDGVAINLSTTATQTGCTGSTGTATANVSGGTPPFVYAWSPSGGNGPVASNLGPGTYTVVVSDASGCTAISQATVSSIGLFTLATQFVPLTCDPLGTTSATVTVTGGTPPFTYLWSPTGGNLATASGITSGNYVIYVTDANSCADSAFVNIPAVVPVQISIGTSSVQCNLPNSGSATATVTSGNAPYTYLWSDGSTTAAINNVGGGTYTVTVTDANGCTSTANAVVGVIPDVLVSAGTDQNVCSGQPATLTALATGGTAPFGYSWSNGSTSNPETVNPTVTTTYTVTVIDANGCQANSSVMVNVQDYPVVTLSAPAFICYGENTTLTASGGSTYSWTPSAGLSDPNSANPVANPTISTTYTVTVSTGACSATGTVDVTVSPELVAGFTPDTTGGEAPLTVNFLNSSVGASGYVWSFGDGSTSTNENPTYTYTQQGSYPVILVASNSLGCTDTIRYSFIIVDELASLTVPNVFTPNGDGLNDTFSFIEKGISAISVKILNRWGREVYSWSTTNSGWNGLSKDGKELPDGVYLYIINAQGIDDKPYNYQGTVQLIRTK